jgi:gamma-glutamylcyclotransferase (GGCT)/AIG2-like uncharacterized protein YtfP
MLPVFVYGTLRPGRGNDRLWQCKATHHHDGEAMARGYRLVHNGAYPYAIPAPDEFAVGCLLRPLWTKYREVVAEMDRLEGVAYDHYKRVAVTVELAKGREQAWIYTPVDPDHYANHPKVPGNDWARVGEDEPHQLVFG